MFWSGADFEESNLNVVGKKFKDASVFYSAVNEINEDELIIWLKKQEKFNGFKKTSLNEKVS